MLRSLAIVLAGLGLAGCQQQLSPVEFDKMVQFEPAPLYCYTSLAAATCYAKPLSASQQDRLVGYYGPPPPYEAIYPRTPDRMPPPSHAGDTPEAQPRMPVDAKPLPKVAPPAAVPKSSS
jgi:hypothetical protein